MPKYRNKSQVIQPLLLGDRRILIKPGHVVDIPKELQLQFFENLVKVADNTPVTPPSDDLPVSSIADQLHEPQPVPQQKRPQQNNPFVQKQQHPPGPALGPVSREEFERLKADVALILKRLEIMKSVLQSVKPPNEQPKPNDVQ